MRGEGAGFQPCLDENAEGFGLRGEGGFLPREDEGHGDVWDEGGEGEGGGVGDDAFGDDAEADAGFDVGEDGADEAWGAGEDGRESGVSATGEDGVVDADAFTACEDDEFFSFEGVPGEGFAFCERVLGWGDDAERFFAEGEGVEAEIAGEGNGAGESEGEASVCDHFPDAFGGSFFEEERNFWMEAPVFCEEAAEEVASWRADVADTEFAFFAAGGTLDGLEGGLVLFEQGSGFCEEGGSCLGEAHAFAVPVEEDGAEVLFHFLDGAAEGGLSDAESRGGF